MKQKISLTLILILILQIIVPTINPLLDFIITNNSIAADILAIWDISEENSERSVWAELRTDGNLRIFGTGKMKDFNTEDAPWWNYGYEDKIKEVIIEDGIETIGSKAFEDLYNLTKVTIPETVENIADNSFEGCKKLMEVHWYLSGNMFDYIPFEDLSPNIFLKWEIGDTKKENVIASLNLKTGHLNISGIGNMMSGQYPWYHNTLGTKIKTVEIIEGITNIGDSIFEGCNNLENITIPESVSYIDYRAFYGCSILQEIKIYYDTWFDDEALVGCPAEIIYVWNLSENIKAELNTTTGKLIIDGTGAIDDYHIFDGGIPNTPWREFHNDISSVEINSGISKIGNNTFYNCTNLKNVVISNTVTKIGEQAFKFCESLTEITIPDSVTKIGDGAFAYCSSITEITIPSSVTEIESSAFLRMRELK